MGRLEAHDLEAIANRYRGAGADNDLELEWSRVAAPLIMKTPPHAAHLSAAFAAVMCGLGVLE